MSQVRILRDLRDEIRSKSLSHGVVLLRLLRSLGFVDVDDALFQGGVAGRDRQALVVRRVRLIVFFHRVERGTLPTITLGPGRVQLNATFRILQRSFVVLELHVRGRAVREISMLGGVKRNSFRVLFHGLVIILRL